MRYNSAWKFFLLGVMALVAGCMPYVNIPGQQGDHLAVHNPNHKNVRNIMAEALKAVIAYRPVEGNYQVILPKGTLPMTYAAFLPRLGEQAMWSSDGSRGEAPVYEVRGLRLRGANAQVDIIRPKGTTPPLNAQSQLVTVDLKFFIDGWHHTRLRVWNAPVEEALRMTAPTLEASSAPPVSEAPPVSATSPSPTLTPIPSLEMTP